MCSTPRYSAKPHSTHRLSVGTSYHKSYSQMMRDASQRYEQRQKELAKIRAELIQKDKMEADERDTLNLESESINEDKSTPLKSPEAGFFMRIILKLFSFIERKPSRIYHEYHKKTIEHE